MQICEALAKETSILTETKQLSDSRCECRRLAAGVEPAFRVVRQACWVIDLALTKQFWVVSSKTGVTIYLVQLLC